MTFLDVLAKLRKATINFVTPVRPSVHPSVRMQQLGFHWTDVDEIWFFIFSQKSVEEIQFSLKSCKNNGYLHEDVFKFMIISRWIFLRIRNILNYVVEKIKTHILCSVTFLRESYSLWHNVENSGGAREAAGDNIAARCMLN